MSKKWIVYRHIFPNGKSYIGITSKKPNDRWRNGEGYKTQKVYRPISKYGWDNVKHEILYENLSLDEANEKEKELIAKHYTFIYWKKSKGYNCTLGGDGTCGTPLTEEQKILLAKIHNSKEFKDMLVSRNKEMSKKVYQYSLDGSFIDEYDSFVAASSEYEVSCASLSYAVRNENLCCGYQWRTFKAETIDKYVNKKLVPVIQFNLSNGKILNRFNSIVEAENETGISHSSITSVCTKRSKSAGGFGWKYDDGKEILLSDFERLTTGEDVYQFTRDYKLVGMYESQRQASEITGIDYRLINKSVTNHSVTKGYIFLKPLDIDYLEDIKQKMSIPIHKYDLDGNYICSYKHRYWVHTNLGVPLRRIGEGYMSGGFQWVQGITYKNKISPYHNRHSKIVNQYDMNLKFIRQYKSIIEAEQETGATNIALCVKRKRKSSGGFIWRYVDDCSDVEQGDFVKPYASIGRKVTQKDLTGTILNIFMSMADAERTTGIKKGSIFYCCKGLSKSAGGYLWQYADEF